MCVTYSVCVFSFWACTSDIFPEKSNQTENQPCSLSFQQPLKIPTSVIFRHEESMPLFCHRPGSSVTFCWKDPLAGSFREDRAGVLNLYSDIFLNISY